ncbi:MAG: DNA polymerase III subunit gamma/tau, partial [Pseudomonadales bacterium]|nr:DNA polymerase III subunit gamma/tau [Pseudomonadales bacterium]
MSYQVLARKWRPRFFREMVGQEHVLQALINALDNDRLHHAYLFTGTRGVGKTTIARILAKCLNCEVGVSSEPCGECSSCLEINQGSFIDLIEVDAASRTKVEDTRDLLDNVQYAPAKGRYKVYLIDEVHMLSTHSFNALLKTLEEPPAHVKFLLATTDPQKLPATILSRCLQFHLKNMLPERIVGHLDYVLGQEKVEFEEPALWALARSADGSMRDALSLTDQAIAFGSGKVFESQVREMLGSIDQQTVYLLAEALVAHDAKKLLAVITDFSEQAPDYAGVLDELLLLLHRMTIAQVVPDAIDNSLGDQQRVIALAQSVTAEELQLFYQMGLMAKKDFALAPDMRSGLEMAVLRMLIFRPEGLAEPPSQVLVNAPAVNEVPAEVSEKPLDMNEKPVAVEEKQVVVDVIEEKPVQTEVIEPEKKPEASVVAVATAEVLPATALPATAAVLPAAEKNVEVVAAVEKVAATVTNVVHISSASTSLEAAPEPVAIPQADLAQLID